jgi:hypothetical protein
MDMQSVIRKELFKYGFVPILIVLERMEKLEEYEICFIILQTLIIHSGKYDLDLPTKLNGEAIAQMKIYFMTEFNLSGDIAYKNSEHYADEIMKEIEKQKK